MKNSHLSLDDRKKIQEGIENELTKVQIAKNIGKDPTTVSKEIKNRRKLKPRNSFNNPITCTKFKLNGKTPYETFEFLYNAEILKKLNVQKIEKDMVTL